MVHNLGGCKAEGAHAVACTACYSCISKRISALMYRNMDLVENLHTYEFWGAEQWLNLNDPQSANSTPWSCFGSKYGVRLVCIENGNERNASVGALLFFSLTFSPIS